jgi:hypothetical protein
VLDERDRAFLGDRAALVVGFVGPDGRPRAARGWSLEIDDDGTLCRLLVEDFEAPHLRHLVPGGLIAVTGADVPTLKAFGLKGEVVSLEVADDRDRSRYERHCDAFFDDIEVTDHTPRQLLDRMRPGELAAVTFRVTQTFDQSPGPAAGRCLDGTGESADTGESGDPDGTAGTAP